MSQPPSYESTISETLERMESDWTPRDRIMAAVLPCFIAMNPLTNPQEIVGQASIELAYRWADAVLEYRNRK